MSQGHSSIAGWLRSVLRTEQFAFAVAVLLAELVLLAAYASRPSARITNPWPMVYPFVWIDASLYVLVAMARRPRPSTTARRRRLVGLLATGYFAVLAHFGGLYGWYGTGLGLSIDVALPPGASPALLYSGHPLVLVLQPYKVLGYLTLAYLVYRTILHAAVSGRSIVSGFVGLFSCVSCSWPLIALFASAVFGGTSAVAAVALTHDYLLSTAIFLSSVGLLYWQPTFGSGPIRRLTA